MAARRGMAARRLAQPGGAGAHGSAAQSRVRAARGEQQCGSGDSDGATNERDERARKLVERDGTREARASVHLLASI